LSLVLQDPWGRSFRYLRLSLTDACNFRCAYCLPDGYRRQEGTEDPLTPDEIQALVHGFASIGFEKVRLTGGEPTLRRDLVEIVGRVAVEPGIRKVALSTNGYRLRGLAEPLRRAGLTAVNVSVDTLDPEKFERITGRRLRAEILEGIDSAIEAGFDPIKINVVLLRGLNDGELPAFLEYARSRPVSVRFIELMRTGENALFFEGRHVPASEFRAELLRSGWRQRPRSSTDGPAVEFEHPEYFGRVGLIAPYSKDFCSTCNRLRVSSLGKLRLCLFGDGDYPLRPLLAPGRREEFVAAIRSLIEGKPLSHLLHEGKYGNTAHLASIGG